MAERYNYDLQRERLVWLADVIAEYVADKDRQYGSSWRKRGGAGAFMVMARKWDRIETACEWEDGDYNIFRVFDSDDRQENIGDDVIDLSCRTKAIQFIKKRFLGKRISTMYW